MVNPSKLYEDLNVAGRNHLQTFHNYITKPSDIESQENWFKYTVFEKVSITDDYIDFSFYGRSLRLLYELEIEQQVCLIKLYERTYMKTDKDNNPIWDFFHIADMDLKFGIGSSITFLSDKATQVIPGLGKEIVISMVEMKRQYVIQLEKCILSLPRREGIS